MAIKSRNTYKQIHPKQSMGFFNRKPKFLDLTEHYKKQQEKTEAIKEEAKESSSTESAFGFLGNMASAGSGSSETESSNYIDVSANVNEKRRRLAKRFMDMTSKIEDLNNQIYHLQQRIEVLEKKSNVNTFD